jgi:hypothetical protein
LLPVRSFQSHHFAPIPSIRPPLLLIGWIGAAAAFGASAAVGTVGKPAGKWCDEVSVRLRAPWSCSNGWHFFSAQPGHCVVENSATNVPSNRSVVSTRSEPMIPPNVTNRPGGTTTVHPGVVAALASVRLKASALVKAAWLPVAPATAPKSAMDS